jgi:DNA-binding response OmpR family regulator
LLARLKGLLRRAEWTGGHKETVAPAAATEAASDDLAAYGVFSFAGRTIDFGRLELRTRNATIRLTLMEAELLRYLIRSAGQVVSRKAILENVWGLREDTDTRAIDNFIVRLRRYIEDDPGRPRHLLTIRGVGYRFLAEP